MENLSDILRRTVSNRPSRPVDDTVHDQPTRSDVGKCPICNGVGWVTNNVPVTDPDFGQVYPCKCQKSDLNGARRSKALERYSRLGILRASTFAAVNPDGPTDDIVSTRAFVAVLDAAVRYAEDPVGWFTITGPSGAGKTYLAAAIVNRQIDLGNPALLVTAADLLDYLRTGFDNDYEESSFADLFEQVRNASFLALDDLPVSPTTSWGQDRLLQLLAHRHSVRLPTVITVRGSLDQADDFLRTRLDTADGFSKVYSLGRPVNVAMRKLGEISAAMADRMTFDSFRTDGGGIFTPEEAAAFAVAHAYVKRWAHTERPNGWLMLMGPYGVGKTHLAVAAAVARRDLGDDVYFSTIANLLDHLRAAYSPDSAVAHADLLMRISSAQLLVLDDLGAERSTPFAEDKLLQIVNHRYEERLPTIITTSDRLSDIDAARPRIASRLLDRMVVTVLQLQGPDYRRHSVPGGESAQYP